MKEIKFRVWDKEHEEMINWEQYKDELVTEDFTDDNLIIMQYTGLKDKNEVDIYDGDIVKQIFILCVDASDGGEFISGYHKGEVVIIASKGVCIKNPILNSSENSEDYRLNQYKNVVGYRSEVIGNIHENPELLEVK